MDSAGRLVEDWGTVGVRLSGANLPSSAPIRMEAVQLERLIPAARAISQRGPVMLTLTAYRAPIWPSGVDVLAVRLQETSGQPVQLCLSLDLPPKTRIGNRTVTLGGRRVVMCPNPQPGEMPMREWGSCDDAVALSNWAKPQAPCDLSFRNIRAGMGGVPIRYQFTVPKQSSAKVVLGFCESHWSDAESRILLCRVEGASAQTVDPIAKWGRHKPGVVLFDAVDENNDGKLDIMIDAAMSASDRNPILNVIWIFPPRTSLNLNDVLAGKLNSAAIYHVDVGGTNDQSLFPNDNVEYHIRLPSRGVRELTFCVACSGGSAPSPFTSAWSPETLLRAALRVWRDR